MLAYRWNDKTAAVLVRALELIPFFAAMDFYQDQAFLRHAIFESVLSNKLVIRMGSMNRYCRHPWSDSCYFKSICLSPQILISYVLVAGAASKIAAAPAVP